MEDLSYAKTKNIYKNEFESKLPQMIRRAGSLPVSEVLNSPSILLGEATQCFIYGYFDASVALSRATLEQVLKHKLDIDKDEEVGLGCLIKVATDHKLLKGQLRSEAIKIQKWGNVYIHDKKKRWAISFTGEACKRDRISP